MELIPLPQAQNSKPCGVESEFALYLKEERGLSQKTVDRYMPIISSFLSGYPSSGPAILNKINISDVTRFVVNQVSSKSRSTAQLIASVIRVFLRFLRYRGDITSDLAAGVPTVANCRSQIPKHLTSAEVEQLLANCDRNTDIGKRDYAVLCLLARLGLRAGAVANLTMDDINWDAGVITIHGKGGRIVQLPITQGVGEALVAYLLHGRPTCQTRKIFLRATAPIQGFSDSGAIGHIVYRALARAGLKPKKSAHLLRHSLATNMLRQSASLAEIGEVLGHLRASTTEIYAKVDVVALRTLAQPWPGGDA